MFKCFFSTFQTIDSFKRTGWVNISRHLFAPNFKSNQLKPLSDFAHHGPFIFSKTGFKQFLLPIKRFFVALKTICVGL